ncbi:hypothetical protein PVAP13_7NG288124 [Panicum virgatum]|uniref:Uncharacterized protein n=1 Tax=Panicum virgatum TaxID=38727 RepID=A0A8T0Q443_PANVG|nr:hypothetical protein PVAP13_7NG288124 [Panicum virgatum]
MISLSTQGRRMEKPGETCSCSPHPSSSKPTPAPEAKFSRRSGSPAIRTPSICSSWPAWQPTGRSSAALLLAPRRDCRGSNPSTPWIMNPSTRRSHLHLRLRICIVQVCTTPRRQPSSSANSSSSAIVDKELGVGDLEGARKENRGRRRIRKGHACATTAAASPLSSSSASSTSAPSRRRPSSSHLPHTRHPPSARGRESATAPALATAPAPSRG